MTLRFTTLASGSGGNATLIEAKDFALLIDAGLGPRVLAARLSAAGSSWSRLHAVLLTHTHTDHWDDGTLTQLWQRRIPLHCHTTHRPRLQAWSRGFQLLESANLVHDFGSGSELHLAPHLRCLPLPVRHDSGPTFGFRLEGTPDLFGGASALAYAADLGCWDASLAASLADVDLLALEFNHDVALEVASGRSPALVSRVLGDEGHLSNEQAADLLKEVVRRSSPGRLKHLVQLHLSHECNRAFLAEEAARAVFRQLGQQPEVHTARQDYPGPTLVVGHDGTGPRRKRSIRGTRSVESKVETAWLPGLDPSQDSAL